MNEQTLEQVINEYLSLGINQQLDYDKFYLYSVITHSTAIEGSTITEIENQLLFDEGMGTNKPIKEQLMNLDLKNAYEKSFRYAKEQKKITIPLLCELSAELMKNTGSEYKSIMGTFSSTRGELRLVNVSAGKGGKSYLPWQKVPKKLEEFCDWINSRRKEYDKMTLEEKYKFSFEVHYNLVSIHPWADGNGRMSRLVMNMIQYEAGIIPSIVKKENKLEYSNSLATCQEKENSKEFITFMINHHKSNIFQEIEEYKKSMNSDFTMSNSSEKSITSKDDIGSQYIKSFLQNYAKPLDEVTKIATKSVLDAITDPGSRVAAQSMLKTFIKENKVDTKEGVRNYAKEHGLLKSGDKTISV